MLIKKCERLKINDNPTPIYASNLKYSHYIVRSVASIQACGSTELEHPTDGDALRK